MGRTGLPAQAHGAKATSSLTGATMALGPPRLRLLGRLSVDARTGVAEALEQADPPTRSPGVPSAAAGRRAQGLLTATCGVRSLPWGGPRGGRAPLSRALLSLFQ